MENSQSSEQKPAGENSAPTVHHITRNDLPLSCPLPSASQWNAHPRVFLPIEKSGEATCPYCGTQYVLKDA